VCWPFTRASVLADDRSVFQSEGGEMTKIFSSRSVWILVLAIAMLSSSCSDQGTSDKTSSGSKPQRGGDLVFVRAADNTSMDPTKTADNETIWTIEQMFETLYAVTPDGKDVRPWLATGYDVSSDRKTYTFTLREGVQFSNGQPLKAADVAFSINRARKSGEGLTYIDASIKSVTAPDDSTVVVKTKYPWAPLVADISLFVNGVVPANFGGKSEKAFFEDPIGTGPFMLDEWKHGDSVKLVRNPNYWQDGKPYLDSITYTNVANENTRVLQLKGGQAQIVRFPPFSSIDSLSQTPGTVSKQFPSTRVDYLLMNEKVAPYRDVHVRRAISYAINRAAMIKAILFGHGQPADSILGPTEPFYQPNPEIKFDLDLAKKEMSQSSVPNGFKTTFLATPDDKIAEVVQQELKPLGIDVSIKTVDINQIFTIQGKGDYEISDDYWTEDIPDPDERISWFLNPSAGGNDYFTYYDNPHMESLVQRATREFNEDKRAQIYAQIQALHAHDLPQIPLYYSPYAYAHSDKVHGFSVYPLGNSHMEDVWLNQ
jgi:peptide/nickel transport system substrate-binding protein